MWRAKGIVSYGEIARDGELRSSSSHRLVELCPQAYKFLAFEVLGSVLVAGILIDKSFTIDSGCL